MDIELRQLRSFIAVVEAGSFTDAAIDLGISQTTVTRNVAALEAALGVRLLQRTTRWVDVTAAGELALRHARRVFGTLHDLEEEILTGSRVIRIGYPWSALGQHTAEFQRKWPASFPNMTLQLVKTNTRTAGLSEGKTDLGILRYQPDAKGLHHEVIGEEARYCAMVSGDPLARRKSVTLAQAATLPLAVDLRTGSTRLSLWPEDAQPTIIHTDDVDDWLTAIGSGSARGVTAASTTHQYRRPGIVYRPIRDAPPVLVYAAWVESNPPMGCHEIVDLMATLYGYSR
ncbi:LysR family transcriptional regulator [Arthrobacter tumbae]|uniref:LysR family transcriptional regulator n=1 Tax=Arthrobacter tumbae TaxID=163874 RepID=UPI00195D6E10|nr:LysR family transcriptional regulator [Arthrobacter tumbae]MBM7781173.1 DNA-binding transcriptional LysR family regulator [Arthrobacter tumbae]